MRLQKARKDIRQWFGVPEGMTGPKCPDRVAGHRRYDG